MAQSRFRMRAFADALDMYIRHNDQWEALCDMCGRCCFERELTDSGEVVINYAAPCEFLDLQTRSCTVYDCRFERCQACRKLSPATVFLANHLPDECAYVRAFLDT
ncbi:hypothetical protein AALA21_05345 [Eggerthellaceae bacterium 3-80]|nr:hypothetical protein D7W09_04990 [bacterium D16-34]